MIVIDLVLVSAANLIASSTLGASTIVSFFTVSLISIFSSLKLKSVSTILAIIISSFSLSNLSLLGISSTLRAVCSLVFLYLSDANILVRINAGISFQFLPIFVRRSYSF